MERSTGRSVPELQLPELSPSCRLLWDTFIELHNKRGADKGGAVGDGRAPEDQNFYHEVVEALKGAQEILIVGPASAKLNLVKHIHRHDQQMVDKVVGVESADHPSDAQLVVYARKYFVAADRMRP